MYSDHLTSEQLDSLEYYGRANDPRIYEGFLDWIAESGFSIGLITRLKHPEYLSNELMARDGLGEASLVLIIFGYELFSKSRARAMCLKNLIGRAEVKSVLQHSIAAPRAVENHSHVMSEFRSSKWKTLFEPSYHELSLNSKEPPGFAEFAQGFDSVLLFLGNFFYVKGVDLALESFLNLKSKNIGLAIVGQSSTVNFEFTKYIDIIRDHRGIYHLDRVASDSEMAYLLESADVLLLPYRSTYAYGTSGLVLLGLQYGKKIIVPNIDPFTLLSYTESCYFLIVSVRNRAWSPP